MKRMIPAVLTLCCFLVPSASAVEYKWDGGKFVEMPAEPATMVVPPGHHAHVTMDGRTIVHSDSNFGDPAAHSGIARPWPKTAFPGDTVTLDAPVQTAFGDPCPNGVCPRATRIPNYTETVQSVHSVQSGRKGLLARIADNIRSRRQARGGLFGGCR